MPALGTGFQKQRRDHGSAAVFSELPAPCAAQWAKVGAIGVSELIGEREKREAK